MTGLDFAGEMVEYKAMVHGPLTAGIASGKLRIPSEHLLASIGQAPRQYSLTTLERSK